MIKLNYIERIRMTLVNKTFEQMQEEIGFKKFSRYDNICPEKNPELFYRSSFEDNSNIFLPKSGYIRELLGPSRFSDYHEQLIHEILLNAHQRAHNCNGSMNISIKVAEGSRGYILRFRDSGNGFDFKDKIKKMGLGEKYYEGEGCGLLNLTESDIEASYEGDGSILNVMIMNGGLKD